MQEILSLEDPSGVSSAPCESSPRLLLGELLVSRGTVAIDQVREAQAVQRQKGGRLGEVLIALGYLSEETLCEALASQFSIPFMRLDGIRPDESLRQLVNPVYAARNLVVPIASIGKELTIALGDPTKHLCIADLTAMTGMRVAPILARPSEVRAVYKLLYGRDVDDENLRRMVSTTEACFGEGSGAALAGAEEPDPASQELASSRESIDLEVEEDSAATLSSRYTVSMEDSPVVLDIAQALIAQALAQRASDVHLEIDPSGPHLRYRIDGILYERTLGPLHAQFRANYRSVLARLKVVANLDIAEKRRPQDGSFRMRTRRNGAITLVDFRIATLPTRFGETMVIRILDPSAARHTMKTLGFSEEIRVGFERLLTRSSGIVLVTGPTGSGKSSTLYAALRAIYRPGIKILTVEDPVEYTHPGICQSEVNTTIDNTFARYLRSFLRNDPDVIMVGEIRDAETAQMVLHAAGTGHLILTTLHSNNSTASIQRLRELVDDVNMLSSSLLGVVAQRLVRLNCPFCSETYQPGSEVVRELFDDRIPDREWIRGGGCEQCNNTGFAGRIAVGELWIPSPAEILLINKGADFEEIREFALGRMRGLGEDGLRKVMEGKTTLEEVLRILPFDEVRRARDLCCGAGGFFGRHPAPPPEAPDLRSVETAALEDSWIEPGVGAESARPIEESIAPQGREAA